MTIKSVFVGTFIGPEVEEIRPAHSLVAYAIALANAHQAHLTIGVGSCAYSIPSAAGVPQARDLVAGANRERRLKLVQVGEEWRREATASGVIASLTFSHDSYPDVVAHFRKVARGVDIILMQPSDETMSLTQGLLEEMLFDTGRPVIIVPSAWSTGAVVKTALVAWDGSAKAARALGDAMPLLASAQQIEIVVVEGDPEVAKKIDSSTIAAHVSRHNDRVQVTKLPCLDGDVAQVLATHAALTRATLIVMGAYGHSKLREFILGGVTRSMITRPPIPILMSY